MEKIGKADELRNLLVVARALRRSAAESRDAQYVRLFLTAALSLEDRAYRIANDLPANDRGELHRPIDLVC
jgi:hypothetical protein